MLSKTCTAITFLLTCHLAFGDTFVMKDGSQLKGSIVRETDSAIFVRIKVKPTIFEQRELAKSDLAEIIPDEQGLAEFKALGKLDSLPDFSSAEAYETRIQEIKAFIEQFPDSSKKSQLSTYLQSLEMELAKVQNGQLKLEGVWLTEDEIGRRQYEIEAKRFLLDLTEKYRRGLVLGALRDFHTNYPNFTHSSLAPKIRAVAAKSMRRYKNYLEGEIEASKKRNEKREDGLASRSSAERERLKKLFAAEQDKYKKRAQRDEAEGQIWLVVSGYDTEGLEDALKLIEQEKRKLQSKQHSEQVAAEQAFNQFWNAIDNAQIDDASEALDQIEQMNLNDSYLAPAKAALEALEAQQLEQEKLNAAEEDKEDDNGDGDDQPTDSEKAAPAETEETPTPEQQPDNE